MAAQQPPPEDGSEEAPKKEPSSDEFRAALGRMGVSNNFVVGSGPIILGNVSVDGELYHSDSAAKRELRQVMRRREEFVTEFLSGALRQATVTFRLSIIFMSVGGFIVLLAATLAILNGGNGASNQVSLVSGLAGAVLTASGAAFWLRAERARAHLERQAARVYDELAHERRSDQIVELAAAMSDPSLGDKARAALILGMMGADSTLPFDRSEAAAPPTDSIGGNDNALPSGRAPRAES